MRIYRDSQLFDYSITASPCCKHDFSVDDLRGADVIYDWDSARREPNSEWVRSKHGFEVPFLARPKGCNWKQ
jgi:hypothetical protein